MKLSPAARLTGRLTVPGDKSISHRAAIIASLAEGSSNIQNYSSSQDCASTLACLRSLGVSVEQRGSRVRIEGRGALGYSEPQVALDCGNSGSTMRMLAGVLAAQDFESVLTGDNSLRSRPMQRVVEPLSLMGARIVTDNGKPPMRIAGSTKLRAIRYELPVPSAQVKSCILLAALNAEGFSEVIEARGPTRDHTERMLKWFGVPAEIHPLPVNTIGLRGPVRFSAREIMIPGDISSAAFFIGAAALLSGSDLTIEGVGLNPTRSRLISLLQSLGCAIETTGEHEVCNEPIGNVTIRGGDCSNSSQLPVRLEGEVIAELIDELPLLAVIGCQLTGGLEIRDATELRSKETDRIAATVINLRAMGADVEEFSDGFRVSGQTRLRGASLSTFGDHRIAMAFAVAALIAAGESQLDDPGCVGVSFPEFFDLLDSVIER